MADGMTSDDLHTSLTLKAILNLENPHICPASQVHKPFWYRSTNNSQPLQVAYFLHDSNLNV